MLLGREQYCISYFATIFMFVYLYTRYCVFFGWFTSTVLESSPKKQLYGKTGVGHFTNLHFFVRWRVYNCNIIDQQKNIPRKSRFSRDFWGKSIPGCWNPIPNQQYHHPKSQQMTRLVHAKARRINLKPKEAVLDSERVMSSPECLGRQKSWVGVSFLDTLQGTNISHLGKFGKSSTQKCRYCGDMLVSRRVCFLNIGGGVHFFSSPIATCSIEPQKHAACSYGKCID